MYKITKKQQLAPSIIKINIEAPLIAAKAKPGQFVIVRANDECERIPLTISDYNAFEALLAAALIAVVTFVICYVGIIIGRKVGTKFAGKAGILGGAILIFIGLEIFITSFIGYDKNGAGKPAPFFV